MIQYPINTDNYHGPVKVYFVGQCYWSVAKVLAAKLEDLSSIPRAYKVAGENEFLQVVL